MNKQNNLATQKSILRQKAEELMKKKPPASGSHRSEADILKLIHELEVHQIELELQNEELQKERSVAGLAADKYIEIYDFAPTGYFTLSKAGKIIELNLSGSQMLGNDQSFLKNSSFSLFVSTDTKPIFNHFIKMVFTEKTKETCEVSLSVKDNLSVQVQLIGNSTENGEQCIVSAIDISDRKRAEKLLKESEDKFRLLADYAYDWEYWAGKDRQMIYISPSCERISGYTAEEFFSDHLLMKKIIHPDDINLVNEHFENVYSSEHLQDTEELEFRILKKDGTEAHIAHLCQPALDEKGNFMGRRVSNREITGQKRASEELRESEEKFKSIYERSNDAIMLLNEKGFLHCNPKTLELFGINSLEEFINHHPSELSPLTQPDGRNSVESADEKIRIAYQQGLNHFDWIHRRLNGEDFKAEVLLSAFNLNGERALQATVRDISERKRAEELLHLSEERYRTIIDNIGEGIGFVNTEERFEFANSAAEKIFGVEPGGLRGLNLNQFVSPEQYSLIQKETSIRVRGKKSVYELEIIRPNGEKRTIVITAVAHIDKEERFMGTYGVFRDMTESKLAIEELKYVLSLNDASLESIHNGILVVSDQGTVIKTNAKFAEMWRIPADILASGDDKKLMNNILGQLADPDRFVATVMELYAKPEADSFDLICFKDGRIFERISKPMFLEAKPKGRVWSFLDITKRKQAEEALAREQYLMQMLMDNLPDHIYFKDLESRFIRINKAHSLLFGFDNPEQAIGKTDADFFSGEHSQQAYEDEQTIIRTGQPLSIEEKETYHDDRPDTWVSTIKMPLYNKEKKIIGTFGISRDVTKQQSAQQEIKLKNEELQKVNAEKDKFFSIIAHDLRGPFSGFLGLTQMMAEQLSSLTMAEIQDLSGIMKDSATNLYRLLENLLQWSKMQQGLIRFDLKEIQLHPVVDESITMVQDIAKNKGIEITSDIPDDIMVCADSNILQTIIRNLISNAVKFTHKGGKINISGRTIDDKSVEIAIKDTGIGMSPEMVSKLFQINVQTNRKGTEGEPSTGLGLLLCKEFIEKLSGKFWVESEERKGSVFYFTLPDNAANDEFTG